MCVSTNVQVIGWFLHVQGLTEQCSSLELLTLPTCLLDTISSQTVWLHFSSLNILCLATQHAVEYPDACIHHLFLDLVHDIRLLHDTTQSQLVNLTFPDKSLHHYIFQRLLQTSLLGQTGSQSL